MDWRELLADIIKRQPAAPEGGHRRSEAAVNRYLQETVAPAFEAVRAEAYRRMSFAFPELDFKEGQRREFRAEVALRSGPTAFDVTGYTQDQLIRNFLHEYRKWLGWRHGGTRPR